MLDRFRNPYIEHFLLNITLQETSKMRARNLPTFQRFIDQTGQLPQRMTLGFAAYLLFMKAVRVEDGVFMGEATTEKGVITYPIRDDYADYFFKLWQQTTPTDEASVRQFVATVCGDTTLWEADLSQWAGFTEAVADHLYNLLSLGVEATLERQMVIA